MKGNRERINVVEALRLMIKQIAIPLQILSGAEELLGACHAVAGSVNYQCAGDGSARCCNASSCLTQENRGKKRQIWKTIKNKCVEYLCHHVCQYYFCSKTVWVYGWLSANGSMKCQKNKTPSVIMQKILQSQLLKSEYFTLLCFTQLNMFVFWTVCQTECLLQGLEDLEMTFVISSF